MNVAHVHSQTQIGLDGYSYAVHFAVHSIRMLIRPLKLDNMQNMMEKPDHISRLQESNVVMMGNVLPVNPVPRHAFLPKDFSVWSESACPGAVLVR